MTTREEEFAEAVKDAIGFDFAQVDAVIRSAHGILTPESIEPLIVQRQRALDSFERGFHSRAMLEARVAIATANGVNNALTFAPKIKRDNDRLATVRKPRLTKVNEWIEKQLRGATGETVAEMYKRAPLYVRDGVGEGRFGKRVAAVRKEIKTDANK